MSRKTPRGTPGALGRWVTTKESTMPTTEIPEPDFSAVASTDLHRVSGGASRVTSRSGSTDQITQLMTTLTTSLGQMNNNKSQMDPSMMMMMMMMGGGGGGGGGAAMAPPPPPAAPPPGPVVNVSTRVR
jgi:hypothetical protein